MAIKQVIVMRSDLNMRKGKIAAQASHASMKVLLDQMYEMRKPHSPSGVVRCLDVNDGTPLESWLNGSFTKICLQAGSEEELVSIYEKALEAGLPTALIVDNGKTEFNGVPTKTCCAIGPEKASKIDTITGNLKLF